MSSITEKTAKQLADQRINKTLSSALEDVSIRAEGAEKQIQDLGRKTPQEIYQTRDAGDIALDVAKAGLDVAAKLSIKADKQKAADLVRQADVKIDEVFNKLDYNNPDAMSKFLKDNPVTKITDKLTSDLAFVGESTANEYTHDLKRRAASKVARTQKSYNAHLIKVNVDRLEDSGNQLANNALVENWNQQQLLEGIAKYRQAVNISNLPQAV